jgi:LDH2 family malate/lactate/ureidoglycolate dehydrogenase
MRASSNELGSLLNRVFEGQGFVDFEAATKQVVWLELCGLQGLAHLAGCLDKLDQASDSRMQLCDDSAGQMSLNCCHNSTLAGGGAAVDLALSEALQTGIATLRLEHCHNRIFILQPLAERASRGMNCMAHWQVAGAPVLEHLAIFRAGDSYPNYLVWESLEPAAMHRDDTLTLVCSDAIEALEDYKEQYCSSGTPSLAQVSVAEFQDNERCSMDQGIAVDDAVWQRLCLLGERVLVASTEASRSRGAGPADSGTSGA